MRLLWQLEQQEEGDDPSSAVWLATSDIRGFIETEQEFSFMEVSKICFLGKVSINISQFLYLEVKSGGFPGGSAVKNPSANAGDVGSIPGSERSSGEENGNPFLENPMDRGPWQTTVYGISRESHNLVTNTTAKVKFT